MAKAYYNIFERRKIMANEIFKNLKTRIALKQNTYEYWTEGEGKDYIPLYGEVCFCEIPAPEADATEQTNGSQEATNAPTVLFKVGTGKKDEDGNWVAGTDKTFDQLNWVSALAADVYAWAKAPTKPVYGAEEITGIGEYIAKYVDEELGISVDTNTVYQIVKVSDLEYKLQSKAAGTEAWADVAGSTITIPESTKVEASDNNGYIKVDGEEVKVYELPELTTGDISDFGDYKTKQEAYTAEGAVTKTVTKVEQDANGEVVITYGDIAFPDATVVEDSDKNGYIKVDGEEVQVFDEVFGVDMTTVNALGGIAAGTNLKDKTLHEVLNALLFPYVKPTVGTPSRVPSTTSALEKGNNQTITSVSVTVTKKSEPITKVELLQGSTVIATKEGDEVKNGGTFTFSGLSVSVPSSSVTLTVRVTDAKGSTVTSGATAGWTFVYPYFYGICAGTKTAATLTESDIEAMTKDIKAKGEKSYEYKNMDNQKMVIAYPKAHGTLKKALDPNNFDYIEAYDRAELNITGLDGSTQAYYVYAQKEPTYGTTTMKYQY
jgi:hypothetical protein